MRDIGDRLADMAASLLAFLPQLIGALIVFLIGYIVAKMLQGGTRRLLTAASLDARLRQSDIGRWIERVTATPTRFLSGLVFWVAFLGALAIALSVLNIPALTAFLGVVFAYLPNVLAAAAILIVAGGISAGVAAAVTRAMGDTPTGKVVGIAIPALTMTIATFMALNQLQIARDIVNITFTALVGALALGSALAFGLGGRDVAGQMLQDAYGRGREGVRRAREDMQVARGRSEEMVHQARSAMQDDAQDTRPGAYDPMPQPAFGETIDQSRPRRRKRQ